jgi:hypothetical protein
MQKLTRRLSDKRSPKPFPRAVLCVGESGGTVGVALCAVAPAICFLNATDASAPTPAPVFTLTCPRERTQSRLPTRLSLRARDPSSRREQEREHTQFREAIADSFCPRGGQQHPQHVTHDRRAHRHDPERKLGHYRAGRKFSSRARR